MRTYIKAYTSLNFGQIPPLTTELAALGRLKNRCHHVISVDIDPIFSNLLVTRTCIILWMSSNFGQIGPPTTELAALERLTNTPIDLIMGKMVFPLFLLFLIGSFWYFHVTRTSIKAWMSLNFLKWDLALAHWTQVSDRCPLGYLFPCPSYALFWSYTPFIKTCRWIGQLAWNHFSFLKHFRIVCQTWIKDFAKADIVKIQHKKFKALDLDLKV